MGTYNDWDADLLWQSASVDSITAIARNGSTIVFSGFDDSTDNTTIYYGTLVISPYTLTNQGSSSSSNTYIPAMTYKGSTLITAKASTNLTPQETSLYEGTAGNPLNSRVYGPSTTTKILSLAGNSDYIFTVVSNTNNNSNKKVFISDTTSDPFDEVLFFSHWGPYDIN